MGSQVTARKKKTKPKTASQVEAKATEPAEAAGRVIRVRGAREHNLRGIDVEIPRDELVVITGLSGSGKSSLAFDTIFAEGQRKYMEEPVGVCAPVSRPAQEA